MNYLTELNAYHNWLETNPCDAIEQALWYHLMAINNSCGWCEWFTVANLTLQAKLNGIDRKTLDDRRNKLCQKKRIEYVSQGKKKAGKYRLIAFEGEIAGTPPAIRHLSDTKPSLNRTTLNKLNETKTKDNIPFREIVDFLNQAAGTNYKHSSKRTRDHITARWNDGNRLPDFETVISKKVTDWKGTDMEKFLRPETLFGPKFEGYLNQPDHKTNVVNLSSKGGRKGNEYYGGWGE